MSATSALEGNEDLENVTLVRMEDVQPDRNSNIYDVLNMSPCVINTITDHDYSCVLNDEDSNIGSMVSIAPEEVEEFVDKTLDQESKEINNTNVNQDSWPTLEILPGGVIRHSEKVIPNLHQSDENETEEKDLMYACAKCSERFNELYSLVKHVKSHEDEEKKLRLSKTEGAVRGSLRNDAAELRKYWRNEIAGTSEFPKTNWCNGPKRKIPKRKSSRKQDRGLKGLIGGGSPYDIITRSMIIQKAYYGVPTKKKKIVKYKAKCKIPKK